MFDLKVSISRFKCITVLTFGIGAWKQNEENRLTQIVEQQPPGKIKWDLVSEQMGRTRSRIQCREKW